MSASSATRRRRFATGLGRALAAGQFVGGAAVLARPREVAALAAGRPDGRPPTPVMRFLGARLLVQGAVALVRPSRFVVLGGGAVDALHALSMVGVAGVDARYRRPALLSAGAAAASAAAAYTSAAASAARPADNLS